MRISLLARAARVTPTAMVERGTSTRRRGERRLTDTGRHCTTGNDGRRQIPIARPAQSPAHTRSQELLYHLIRLVECIDVILIVADLRGVGVAASLGRIRMELPDPLAERLP